MTGQRPVLHREHVGCVAAEPPGLQRVGYRLLVDDRAAAHVHQECPGRIRRSANGRRRDASRLSASRSMTTSLLASRSSRPRRAACSRAAAAGRRRARGRRSGSRTAPAARPAPGRPRPCRRSRWWRRAASRRRTAAASRRTRRSGRGGRPRRPGAARDDQAWPQLGRSARSAGPARWSARSRAGRTPRRRSCRSPSALALHPPAAAGSPARNASSTLSAMDTIRPLASAASSATRPGPDPLVRAGQHRVAEAGQVVRRPRDAPSG